MGQFDNCSLPWRVESQNSRLCVWYAAVATYARTELLCLACLGLSTLQSPLNSHRIEAVLDVSRLCSELSWMLMYMGGGCARKVLLLLVNLVMLSRYLAER